MSHLTIDIETFSLDGAAQFIEEPSAPANYKDPEKIAAYIEQKRAENLTRCALDPDLCCIVAIGYTHPVTGEIHVLTMDAESNELSRLRQFWDVVAGHDFVGFNLLGFDLPVLMRRSQYLSVTNYRNTPVDRYRTPHIDLMERLSFNGKLKYRSLDFYCRRFGIDVPDLTSGKDIDAMVKAGDWQGVSDHCRADVQKTRLLAERLSVVSAVEIA